MAGSIAFLSSFQSILALYFFEVFVNNLRGTGTTLNITQVIQPTYGPMTVFHVNTTSSHLALFAQLLQLTAVFNLRHIKKNCRIGLLERSCKPRLQRFPENTYWN